MKDSFYICFDLCHHKKICETYTGTLEGQRFWDFLQNILDFT